MIEKPSKYGSTFRIILGSIFWKALLPKEGYKRILTLAPEIMALEAPVSDSCGNCGRWSGTDSCARKSVRSFGPSRRLLAATMASADFCARPMHVALRLHAPCPRHHRYCRLGDGTQTSPVKSNNDFPSMQPPHLPR